MKNKREIIERLEKYQKEELAMTDSQFLDYGFMVQRQEKELEWVLVDEIKNESSDECAKADVEKEYEITKEEEK